MGIILNANEIKKYTFFNSTNLEKSKQLFGNIL